MRVTVVALSSVQERQRVKGNIHALPRYGALRPGETQAFYDRASEDVNPGRARNAVGSPRENTGRGRGEGSTGDIRLRWRCVRPLIYPAPDDAPAEVRKPLPGQAGNGKVDRGRHILRRKVGKTAYEEQPVRVDTAQELAIIFRTFPGVG